MDYSKLRYEGLKMFPDGCAGCTVSGEHHDNVCGLVVAPDGNSYICAPADHPYEMRRTIMEEVSMGSYVETNTRPCKGRHPEEYLHYGFLCTGKTFQMPCTDGSAARAMDVHVDVDASIPDVDSMLTVLQGIFGAENVTVVDLNNDKDDEEDFVQKPTHNAPRTKQ